MSDNDNLAPRGPPPSGDEEKAGSTHRLSADAQANATPHDTKFEYDQHLAHIAEKKEREMTFKKAAAGDFRLIMYSLGFSGTIIMEGYGLALLTYLFSVEPFNEKYGVKDTNGKYEVCYTSRYDIDWNPVV